MLRWLTLLTCSLLAFAIPVGYLVMLRWLQHNTAVSTSIVCALALYATISLVAFQGIRRGFRAEAFAPPRRITEKRMAISGAVLWPVACGPAGVFLLLVLFEVEL